MDPADTEIKTMTYAVTTRPENTNGGAGFVIEANGYPLEVGMGEACAMHMAIQRGEAAAKRAYERILRDRIAGKGRR
jgi:hypothetical protein